MGMTNDVKVKVTLQWDKLQVNISFKSPFVTLTARSCKIAGIGRRYKFRDFGFDEILKLIRMYTKY